MGGLAFATGHRPLITPRMSPAVYRFVRDRCKEKLRRLYVLVAVPIEGPAKESFGDIDIFVGFEKQTVFPSSRRPEGISNESELNPFKSICEALGAVRHVKSNQAVATLAIPWPENLNPPEDANEGGTISGEYCIQVDVHIFQSLPALQWMLFKHAHGDIWNILGSIIRPFGLTADENGFHIRIPEIEAQNKKEARVLLSRDSQEVLHFLGLKFDQQQWEEPFKCMEDIFEYVATCPFFSIKDSARDEDTTGTDSMDLKEDKKNLTANDRRRLKGRPIFRMWVEEFIPACRASGRFLASKKTLPTRDDVRQQAFNHFLGSQSRYESRLTEWLIKRQRETLWKYVIKPAIPAEVNEYQRGCCAGALKRIILQGDKSFDGIEAPASLKDNKGLFDEEAVRSWVHNNWPMVCTVAWRINQERCAAKKAEKEEALSGTKRTVSGTEKPRLSEAAA